MKIKLLILLLSLWLGSFGQKLPTTNLCLTEILSVTGGTCLSNAFTNANANYFDPAYAIAGSNCLSEFRNYGVYPDPPTDYGYLYNFWALSDIAATGWHVPSDTEWHTLALYLDANATLPLPGSESTVAGAYMKETGTSHWTYPNTGATNSSGFTGLPEGARNEHGVFYNRGLTTTWASSTASGLGYYYRSLGYDNTNIYRNTAYKQYGFSVRLLKNDSTDPGTYTGNDGKTYGTVKIGNQVWTSVNIQETKYNDGTAISFVSNQTAWEALTSGAMCAYVGTTPPSITTSGITSITSTSASSGGNVTSDGGASVTARGVCWGTITEPTTANSHTSDGTGTGIFTSSITGLSAGTTYYVRAYATNSIGTSYGNQNSFLAATVPTVSSDSYTINSLTSVTGSGSISSDGGASVTAKGYCWGTTTNPTTADSHTNDGTGTTSFTSSMTGLTATSTYYARAYATNSVGTAYGSNLTFKTAIYDYPYARLLTVTIPANTSNLSVTWDTTNPTASNASTIVRIQNVTKASAWVQASMVVSYAGEYNVSHSATLAMGVTNVTGDTFDISFSNDNGATWTAPIQVINAYTIPYNINQ